MDAGRERAAERARRTRMLKWIAEMGCDFSEELQKFDNGDFWTRDAVYEEMREAITEYRREERRNMNRSRA